jgi:hypothetical protein
MQAELRLEMQKKKAAKGCVSLVLQGVKNKLKTCPENDASMIVHDMTRADRDTVHDPCRNNAMCAKRNKDYAI